MEEKCRAEMLDVRVCGWGGSWWWACLQRWQFAICQTGTCTSGSLLAVLNGRLVEHRAPSERGAPVCDFDPCPTVPWWGHPLGPVPAPTAVSRHLEQPEKRGNNRWSSEWGREGDWVGGEWVSPFSCFSNNTYSGKPDASRTLSLHSLLSLAPLRWLFI